MIAARSRKTTIFIDRACQGHWVVRDPEGQYWVVPSTERAWEDRRPFTPTQDTQLEAVPGHYKSFLGLPS